jgi:hypothetical protein
MMMILLFFEGLLRHGFVFVVVGMAWTTLFSGTVSGWIECLL